jgi:hypothetical protein
MRVLRFISQMRLNGVQNISIKVLLADKHAFLFFVDCPAFAVRTQYVLHSRLAFLTQTEHV